MAQISSKMKSKGFRIALLILAAFLLYGVMSGLRASTSILISSISEWTGMSYGTVSIAFSVMNIVLAFSGPIFGILTLKIAPAKIMFCGVIIGAIGFIGTAFCNNLPALIVFMGFFFGMGAASLCYSIVYAAAAPVIGMKYSIVFGGILGAAMGAVNMVLAPLIKVGADVLGVQGVLIGIGIVAACLVPLCLLFMPKKADKNTNYQVIKKVEKSEPLFKALKSAVTPSFFIMAAIGMFAIGFCDGGMVNHLFEFTRMYGAPETVSALMVSVYGCSYMVGAVIGGIICSRLKNRKGVFGVIFLFWAFLNIIGYFLPPGYITGYIIFSLCGIGVGMSVPTISAIVQDTVPMSKYAAIFSILFFFVFLAYGIDSIFGGVLYDILGDFKLIDMIAIILALVVGIIFNISGLRDQKEKIARKNKDN